MALTALQDKLQGPPAGGPSGDYRGATTAARFADPQAEWTALRTGCGVYDLGFRAKLGLTGGDRVRWLNGMVTNNVRDLAAGHGVYAFLLNPQGRILADMFIFNRGESLIVDTDAGQVEALLAIFDHYIIMDDVEVTNLSPTLTALGVAGPRSRAVLAAAGLNVADLAPLQAQTMSWQGAECTLVRGEDAEHESYEIWLAPAQVKQLWDALLAAGGMPVGYEALEIQRIVSGIPLYGIDIRERDLPQETEQVRALNFSKGCYVGQEIVERIRSRGNVHRKFTGFISESGGGIERGAKIVAGEKEVGEITSSVSVQLSGAQQTVALGYIRREVGLPGREVMIGSTKATVVQVPLEMTATPQTEHSLAHQ
jgi:folate-binding protein YgfZ